jgi:transposase InsO family protein
MMDVNKELLHYQHTYNHYRPHDFLDLKTPMEYYYQIIEAA